MRVSGNSSTWRPPPRPSTTECHIATRRYEDLRLATRVYRRNSLHEAPPTRVLQRRQRRAPAHHDANSTTTGTDSEQSDIHNELIHDNNNHLHRSPTPSSRRIEHPVSDRHRLDAPPAPASLPHLRDQNVESLEHHVEVLRPRCVPSPQPREDHTDPPALTVFSPDGHVS